MCVCGFGSLEVRKRVSGEEFWRQQPAKCEGFFYLLLLSSHLLRLLRLFRELLCFLSGLLCFLLNVLPGGGGGRSGGDDGGATRREHWRRHAATCRRRQRHRRHGRRRRRHGAPQDRRRGMRREGSDSMAATMVLRRRRLRQRSAAKATVESGHLIFPFGAKRANRAKKEQKLITEEQHFCRNLIGLRSLPSPLSLSPFLSLPLSPLYKRARSSRRLSARSLLERKERERETKAFASGKAREERREPSVDRIVRPQ